MRANFGSDLELQCDVDFEQIYHPSDILFTLVEQKRPGDEHLRIKIGLREVLRFAGLCPSNI